MLSNIFSYVVQFFVICCVQQTIFFVQHSGARLGVYVEVYCIRPHTKLNSCLVQHFICDVFFRWRRGVRSAL